MACMSETQAALVSSKEDESLQELARKLPEGDALPDGFSECPTELESNTHRPEVQVSTEKNGALPEDFRDSHGVTSTCSERSIVSPGSSDAPADLNDGSPCSSPSTRKKDRKERPRSFPVQLSPPDTLEEELASVAENEACLSLEDGNRLVVTAEHIQNFTDGTRVTETRGAKEGETETEKDIDVVEQDASSEIDQIIHGPALSPCTGLDDPVLHDWTIFEDNGVQTVEGLHSCLLEEEIVDLRKQNELLTKEKQMANAQLVKSLLVREKLESLCRELQRHNKQLTDECKLIASEEQQKRLDLSTRFHDAIKDVTAKLEEQGDERLRQIKQNELLQEKLRQFTQQYEFQEQQYSQQLKAKSLEYQILEVKLKQQEEINKQGDATLQSYTEQISSLLQTEQDLRGRLAVYGEKFEQFQDVLTKSNEIFASFKAQMEKMSKTIKKLEKENLTLQRKCEKSDVSLIELVDESSNLKQQLKTTKNQKEKLEALCRTLQAERKQQKLAMASVATSAVASNAVSAISTFNTEEAHQAGK